MSTRKRTALVSEGPHPRAPLARACAPGLLRNRSDLDQGRVTEPTAAKDNVFWKSFRMLAENPEMNPLAEVASWDPIRLATQLEEYERVLYEQGAPRRNYAETINIVIQQFPRRKTLLARPWRLLTTWESSSTTSAEGCGCDSAGVAVDTSFHHVVDRLLRLTATLRAHCLESQRLSVGIRRNLPPPAPGQKSNTGGQNAERKIGCALRGRFFKEMFQGHESSRKDLGFRLNNAPNQTPTGS